MSEKPSENLQSENTCESANGSRLGFVKYFKSFKITWWRFILGVALICALTIAVALYVFRPNALSLATLRNIKVFQAYLSAKQNKVALQSDIKSVFSTNDAGELISSETVLGTVGRNPVDPTRILIATFSRNRGQSTTLLNDQATESQESELGQLKTEDSAQPESSEKTTALKQEPERVPSPEPERAKAASDKEDKVKQDTSADASDTKVNPEQSSADKGKRDSDSTSAESKSKPVVTSPPAVTGIRVTAKSKETGLNGTDKERENAEDQKKPEEYQLPGSLVIDLKNYKGKPTPWGMMIILDDSASMGKKTKPWKPNRMDAAIKFVKGISHIVTPGSKIAVRDFYCSEKRRGRRPQRCKSRLLSEWSSSPFAELKHKLDKVTPVGVNYPCAAIAHSVKKDMLEFKKLYPRVVVITGGITRCPYTRVLRALRSAKASRPVHIDVIGLGMLTKNRKAYNQLTQRTNGVFLHLDDPSHLKQTLSSYKKMLRARNKEEIEVRGGEVVTYGAVGDEITLAPGKYTVKLPEVHGLAETKRTIQNITIESGKNRHLKVSVSKGRLVVRGVN